ncbi:MAG: hypothetical protein A2665_01330 [Candidatus Zambryskibacteria bacterium RIFCSPHIGHO2_01_FULL_46_30]|uniref:Capsule synthesis protein CapA domain-containing protein n=1 Tax=Candidatus Zambryskibacteria bacterium RIFCSPHIGHO2_01_FULL_46_30 TaxID=1802739 RepID=A0A1G2T1D4_9BACT|nr:MAG: hypothetical protein A2665_01330 [Candidatus Zambryskibacteria bacterium RIFCSPHIGHO2_01_FULL_46_30]OHB05651.1 MAG: hypothetical protein A3B22_01660 [Candidatus Zambryskibacteria bacterium RIFCSPLOWO2_01_FULL_47_33]
MEVEFDRTGFKFVVRFAAQFTLIYFLVSFSSNLFFDNIYGDHGYALEVGKENLASVISHETSSADNPAITLGFVGDIMLDRGVWQVVSINGRGDFKFIFERSQEELNNLDLLFGNLEGPVSDKGRDLGALYSFRMNPDVIDALLYAGFSVLSLANNHAGDWGEEALRDSINRLGRAGISHVGAGLSAEEAYKPLVFDVDGFKVAILAFTESTGIYEGGNIALAREEKVRESIQSAQNTDIADFIVAYFHFGDEYQREPNERQRKLSYAAVDSGADLVIGSHSHVTQSAEKYKDSLIVYSLGNFVFDQYFSDETMRGWLLKVFIGSDGEVVGMKLCDVFINPLFQPVVLSCNPAVDFYK